MRLVEKSSPLALIAGARRPMLIIAKCPGIIVAVRAYFVGRGREMRWSKQREMRELQQ